MANEYLDILEARHPSVLDPRAIDRLRVEAQSPEGADQAGRILGRWEKWKYDHPDTLPRENPFQVGDVLAAYWANHTGRWPKPSVSSLNRGGMRRIRITAAFLDLVQQRDVQTAVRWLEIEQPGHARTLARLKVQHHEDGGFDYQHPNKSALKDALTVFRRQLWSVVQTRQADQ